MVESRLGLAIGLALMVAPLEAQQAPVQVVEIHSPAAAGIFSLLIPGAGQAYNGQWLKGALMFGGGFVTLGFAATQECQWPTTHPELKTCSYSDDAGTWLELYFVNSLVSVVDAARVAKRLNAEALARVNVTPAVAMNGRVGLSVSIATP